MADKPFPSPADPTAGYELLESIIYPGSEEKARLNPRWWDTPATRRDPEAESSDEDDSEDN